MKKDRQRILIAQQVQKMIAQKILIVLLRSEFIILFTNHSILVLRWILETNLIKFDNIKGFIFMVLCQLSQKMFDNLVMFEKRLLS